MTKAQEQAEARKGILKNLSINPNQIVANDSNTELIIKTNNEKYPYAKIYICVISQQNAESKISELSQKVIKRNEYKQALEERKMKNATQMPVL